MTATGLIILLKLDSNHRFFSLCDLGIWWMSLENNKAPLLYYSTRQKSLPSWRQALPDTKRRRQTLPASAAWRHSSHPSVWHAIYVGRHELKASPTDVGMLLCCSSLRWGVLLGVLGVGGMGWECVCVCVCGGGGGGGGELWHLNTLFHAIVSNQ